MSDDNDAEPEDVILTRPLRIIDCRPHGDWVTSLAFHPNGRQFLAGRADHVTEFRDVDPQPRTGFLGRLADTVFGDQAIHTFRHGSGVNRVCISKDGSHGLAACGTVENVRGEWKRGKDCSIYYFDLQKGIEAAVLSGHEGFADSVDFCCRDKKALSCSNDGTLRLWDLETKRHDVLSELASAWYTSLDVSPDGLFGIAGRSDGIVELWDLERQSQLQSHDFSPGQNIGAIKWLPDGKHVLCGKFECGIQIFDSADGSTKASLVWSDDGDAEYDGGRTASQNSIAVTPDGRFALTVPKFADDRVSAFLWDIGKQKLASTIRVTMSPGNVLGSCAISPDGKLALTGDSTGSIRVWDVTSVHAPT